MIHTLYSNSYEVLRTVLLSNIEALRLRPEAAGLDGDELFAGVFDRVPVIIPSRAVETDLARAIARQESVCASMKFMFLSEWLGFFSHEPLANVIGSEARWMIWRLLRETGPGSFREEVARQTTRLEDCLRGRSDRELLNLAQRIAGVFVTYSSYRLDWMLDWLDLHRERFEPSPQALAERRELEGDEDALWQRLLLRRLAAAKNWRGRGFLEHLPESLERLARAPARARSLVLGDGRRVDLPNALHVFMPFAVPPLMLPVLKAYAHSGRDVWLYLLNPSGEYWFDLVPRRLYDWRRGAEETGRREVGHPILADNGRSTRANIDRLWRFTEADATGPGDDRASGSGFFGECFEPALAEEEEARLRNLEVPAHARRVIARDDFLAQYLRDPRGLRADIAADSQSIYLEAREPALLRRVQDSILNLDPDLAARAEEDGVPLIAEADDSLRFVAAPTAVRELEGLADWLHAQFRADPTLEPSDVLVVTPDISAAAPLVDRVFGSLPAGRRIAYRTTGAVTVAEDAPLRAVAGLADLVTGRATRDALVSWLSLPLVAERFGLDGDDLELAASWLAAAGFERGISPAHLADIARAEGLAPDALDAVSELTLERALERLALGWALPETAAPAAFGDLVPVTGTEEGARRTTGDAPKLLAALSTLYALLEDMRRAAARPAAEGESYGRRWQRWIADAVGRFLPREDLRRDWSTLRAAADAIAEELEAAEDGAPLEPALPIFMSALGDRLARGAAAGRPGPGVTFTGMSDLRGLPYRIIVIWGLNADSRFPGVSRAEEIDLMARRPRRGDRDSRLDNRNVFLDLLLAARGKLLISYAEGLNPAEREEPSVVAQELRDWLLSHVPAGAERRRAAALLTRRLPLTGFSPAAFAEEAGAHRSTDVRLLAAVKACAATEGTAPPHPWLSPAGMTPDAVERMPFSAFWRWLTDPSAACLRQAGVRLERGERPAPAPVLPKLSGLEGSSRRREALAAVLCADPEARADALAALRGRWERSPRLGALGARDWGLDEPARKAAHAAELYETLTESLERLPPQEVEVRLAAVPWILRFTVTDLWRDADGGEHLIVPTVSGPQGSAARRATLVRAMLAASGREVSAAVIVAEDERKKSSGRGRRGKAGEEAQPPAGPMTVKTPALMTPEQGRRLLELLAEFVESARRGLPLHAGRLWSSDEMPVADLVVWRGRGLDAARLTGVQLFEGIDGISESAAAGISAVEEALTSARDEARAFGATLVGENE